MGPSLVIVIVNWNTGLQLRDCLNSVAASACSSFTLQRVVVVDNSSFDRSMESLPHDRLPLTIMRNPENRGFAAACNQGAAGSHSDFILFLNPDTVLRPDTLDKALSRALLPEQARVGIWGIALRDENDRLACTCANFPRPAIIYSEILGLNRLFPGRFPSHFTTRADRSFSRVVDQVIGAFFLVRREVYDALGGFDERFFVYFEEVDFARRALARGWTSYYFAGAEAFHKGGGASQQAKASRLFYFMRSRILYSFKHMGLLQSAGIAAASLLVEPVARVIFAAAQGEWRTGGSVFVAFAKLWLALPAILRQSRVPAEPAGTRRKVQ